MSTHASVVGLQPRQMWDGVVARPLHGARITVGIVEFEAMTRVAEHRHDNEQLGLVLKGSITTVIDGAAVLDVFSPVRSDWNDTPRMAVAEGRWP